MELIIDRFESDYVVCEDTKTQEIINLNRIYFPEHAKEGDLIEFADGIITVLPNDETKERIEKKMNDLWK